MILTSTPALILAATVSFHFDRPFRRSVAVPLYLATAFSLAGLMITLKAAPIMLSLGNSNALSTSQAFTEFEFWGLCVRGATDLLAFVCEIWALTQVSGSLLK